MLGYIPLNTGQILVCSLCQKLLLATSHSCTFIIKEVVFYRCTQYRKKLIRSSYRKHGRDIIRSIHTMLVIRQFTFSSTNHTKRVSFSGIFNIQVSHELILCTNIQLAPLGIQADNRGKSPSGLTAIQVDADKFCAGRYRSPGRQRQISGGTSIQCTLITTSKVVHTTTRKGRKPVRYLISQAQLY